MNSQLVEFARKTLKEGLSSCSPEQQMIFKRLYSPDDLSLSINTVVDNMRDEQLDWAMQQVQNTLKKNATKRVYADE